MDAHPLDFDWRFTPESTELLVDGLERVAQSCLVIGAPSVWTRLRGANSINQADLVERNPTRHGEYDGCQAGSRFTMDICAAPRLRLASTYDACLFDSPWYLQDTKYWLAWALRNVSPHATIAFSLWPEDTRPTAKDERNEIFHVLERIGRFELHEGILQYEAPEFERRALGVANQWRSGDLVWFRRSDSKELPSDFCPRPVPADAWFRFSVSSKQVAIRAVIRPSPNGIAPLAPGYGWFMKSVSRRDRMRELVDIWTSDGFVARLGNPMQTIDHIRRHAHELNEVTQRTILECTGMDLYANNTDHWTMNEWHYDS